ncbi:MAG: YkgJ family cysteine cluster protein [Desulfuromonadales bacterium]|nr:YkgJ family cysteine cluster protein [Desulfuromonadales bacterium]
MTPLGTGSPLEAALAPYRSLLAQVDQLCDRIVAAFPEQIKCRAGCDACCTLQGVLPVEAACLALAFRQLPAATAEALRARLNAVADEERCPLLTEASCPLYAARPIICRTHGLPLLVEDEHGPRVDRCPLNFTALDTLPGSAIIALEKLNQALVMANRHFLAICFPGGDPAERVPLREIPDFLPPSHS